MTNATFIVCAIFSIVLIILISFFSSMRTIEAGHVGVVKRFGAVKQLPLQPGFSWVSPFWIDSVEEVDTRIKAVEHQSSASSMDMQTVNTGVSVTYYINENSAPTIVQKIGDRSSIENSIISPAIQESVKSVTAKYNAEQLLTERSTVKKAIADEIEDFIKTTMKSKEISLGVIISNVAVTDFQFSDEFNKAIEMKVKSKQEALQAENEKKRRITQAEAAQKEKQLAADAEAYQIEKNAKARSNAIRLEAQALKDQPQLIKLRIAEKWDGALPTFTGDGDGINFLMDMNSLNVKSRKARMILEDMRNAN